MDRVEKQLQREWQATILDRGNKWGRIFIINY